MCTKFGESSFLDTKVVREHDDINYLSSGPEVSHWA